jgi:hypothetical protein
LGSTNTLHSMQDLICSALFAKASQVLMPKIAKLHYTFPSLSAQERQYSKRN